MYPRFGKDVLAMFDLKLAMERRTMIGAPGRKEVAKQLRAWKTKLA